METKKSLWRAAMVPFLFWVEFFGGLILTFIAVSFFLSAIGFKPLAAGSSALAYIEKLVFLAPLALLVFTGYRAWKREKKLMAKQGTSIGTKCAAAIGALSPILLMVLIAWPNLSQFQSKARQSEAKIALAAIYGAEKSHFSQKGAYSTNFEELGYLPESQRRYYSVGFAPSCGAGASRLPMLNNAFVPTSSDPEVEKFFQEQKICRSRTEGFEVYAVGVIIKDGPPDVWRINEKKELENLKLGTRQRYFWER